MSLLIVGVQKIVKFYMSIFIADHGCSMETSKSIPVLKVSATNRRDYLIKASGHAYIIDGVLEAVNSGLNHVGAVSGKYTRMIR